MTLSCSIRHRAMPIIGMSCVGEGTILASIVAASGRSPTILGKPRAPMFDSIRLAFPDVKPNRTMMIGDRLETDILFGNRQGLTTLLVFSGATTEKKLDTIRQSVEKNTAEKELLPKYCIKDVYHLLLLIQSRDKFKCASPS